MNEDTTYLLLTTQGVWETRTGDPVPWDDSAMEWDEALAQAGYRVFMEAGHVDLTVHHCADSSPDRPDFMVTVSGGCADITVFAESLPAVMDLMARWVPVVRDISLINVLTDAGGHQENREHRTFWSFGQLIRTSLL